MTSIKMLDELRRQGIAAGVYTQTTDVEGEINGLMTYDGKYQQSIHDEKWNKYGGPRLSEGYQLATVIDLLRECASLLEPHKLTMVLQPLNWHASHGGTFLQQSDQAFAICRAVNSPSCKILFDIYHQQITEGNLIPNIERCWNDIGYFQTGDNPGRKEPGTGEINYAKVCEYIHPFVSTIFWHCRAQ